MKGGLLGERVLTPADIEALADLPSREVLLAQIAGAFQAPLIKAAGLFQAFTRNFAYGVKALIDQRVAGGEAPAEPRRRPRHRSAAAEARAEAEAAAEPRRPTAEAAPRPKPSPKPRPTSEQPRPRRAEPRPQPSPRSS